MKIESNYPVSIDYDPEADKPSRVFDSLARLVDSCYEIDALLAGTLSGQASVKHRLDRIEIGSLVTWIQSLIEIPDDRELSAKKPKKKKVKAFIEKGRKQIVKSYSKSANLQDPEVYNDIRNDLSALAKDQGVKDDFAWREPTSLKIAETLQLVNNASKDLSAKDSVQVGAAQGKLPPARPLDLMALRESLIAKRDVSIEDVQLIIKKPDLLGESQWDFRLSGKSISARIHDGSWLADLHKRNVRLTTGDSLRVTLRTEIGKDSRGREINIRYEIVKVHSIVDSSDSVQAELFPDEV